MSSRSSVLAAAGSVLALSLLVPLSHCATGTDDTQFGAGGTATVASAGGAAGGGGAAGEGGGVAGAGGEGGEGGEAPACEEPCELMSQCGCSDGFRCHLLGAGGDGGGGSTAVVDCYPEGASQPDTKCNNDCTKGYRCVNAGIVGSALCHEYCEDDGDCFGGGGLCAIPIFGGVARVCSQNCDPVTNLGCLEDDMRCNFAREIEPPNRWYTRCETAGAKQAGEVCVTPSQCAAEHGCIGTDTDPDGPRFCRRWCDLAAPSCPTGSCATLNPPIVIGQVSYGACI